MFLSLHQEGIWQLSGRVRFWWNTFLIIGSVLLCFDITLQVNDQAKVRADEQDGNRISFIIIAGIVFRLHLASGIDTGSLFWSLVGIAGAVLLTDWVKMAVRELAGKVNALFESIEVDGGSIENPQMSVTSPKLPEQKLTIVKGDTLECLARETGVTSLWHAVSEGMY